MTPEQPAPKQTTPEQTAPEQTAPEQTAPERRDPEPTIELARAATAADAADPLARWRDEFYIADDTKAYLDGNSLGMPPAATIGRVEDLITVGWGRDLIASWDEWVHQPRRVGDRLAPLIGATPGEVIVHDSTTINLYQLVTAAVRLRPDHSVIAISADDFPTDRYIVDEVAARFGWTVQSSFDDLSRVGVVVRSMIDYRTAAVADVGTETARAKAAGAITIWDLSHAAGVHPVGANAHGVELAVGCTYKFLNGGPGSPGFSYVAADLIEHIDQPIHGWFSQTDQFAMGADYRPRTDIGRLLIGTPSMLALVAAECGIELSARAGIDAIYAKAQALGDFALRCCDSLGLTSTTPRNPDERGGHVCVTHPDAQHITKRLAAEYNVVADFREPDVIRLGMSPLTTRFADIVQATAAIAALSG